MEHRDHHEHHHVHAEPKGTSTVIVADNAQSLRRSKL